MDCWNPFKAFKKPSKWAWVLACVLAALCSWPYLTQPWQGVNETPSSVRQQRPLSNDNRWSWHYGTVFHATTKSQAAYVPESHWGTLHCRKPDFLLYAYSAFYDDRERSSNYYVRIVASSENPHHVRLRCFIYYSGQIRPTVVTPVFQWVSMAEKYNGKTFREGLYSCPLGTDGAIPESVSVGCDGFSPGEAPFRLRVQIPEKPKRKEGFAVCVCASYGSRNVHQLVEWMELQQIFGVSKVTAYNHSMTDETARIFLHYMREGFVDFRQTVPFRTEATGSPFHNMKMHQGTTVNDCILRNMYSFDRILVMDYDELIVPRQHSNLSEMIAFLNSNYSRGRATNYSFRNQVFPFEFAPDQNISSKLVTMGHRTSLKTESTRHQKTMIDPLICTHMSQHHCHQVIKELQVKRSGLTVNPMYGRNQHYKIFCDPIKKEADCKTTIKNLKQFQDDTMLRFQKQLRPRVARQLEKLGLGGL